MKKYKFVDLNIEMNCKYDIMQRRSEKYLDNTIDSIDLTIDVPERLILEPETRYQKLTPAEIELVLMCSYFARHLLPHNGLLLHSSGIVYENKAILFSADSGVGKSTHTRLWQKHFGKENVPIINDDKPAIRYMNDTFYAYGNPYSGNSDENENLKVPLHAIVFLEQSPTNSICKLEPNEALPLLMKQTLRPNTSPEHMGMLLNLLDQLLSKIPVYLLKCNMDEEVVELVAKTVL